MYSMASSPETSQPDGSILLAAQRMVKNFFHKLDRMMTAIAYAEAGNLDAVKEILEQDRVKAQGNQ